VCRGCHPPSIIICRTYEFRKQQSYREGHGLSQRSDSPFRTAIDEFKKCLELAAGGNGSVFLGLLLGTTDVAIKVVERPTAKEQQRFEREIDLLRPCYHPNGDATASQPFLQFCLATVLCQPSSFRTSFAAAAHKYCDLLPVLHRRCCCRP